MIKFSVLRILEEASLLEMLLLFCPITQLILVIFCNLGFIFYLLITNQKNLSIFSEIFYFLKKSSILSRIRLILFTILFAIPNVILINNGRSVWFTTIFYAVGVFIFQIYPPVALVFFVKFNFWVESLLFGILIDNVSSLKRFLIYSVFNNQLSFSENYITYFFGNPWKASVKQGGSWGGGVLFGFALGKNQQVEGARAESLAKDRLATIMGKGGTSDERQAMFRKEYADVVQKHCPQTQLIADIKAMAIKAMKGASES